MHFKIKMKLTYTIHVILVNDKSHQKQNKIQQIYEDNF